MGCKKCGAPTDFNESYCDQCRRTVRVLNPTEREAFDGVTIDQPGKERKANQDFDSRNRRYVKRIYLAPTGILGKIILGLAAVSLLVVALPLALFFIGIMVIALSLRALTRR